ncbi:putative carboxypeptidase D [Dioscorea sansibarensis]
MVGNALTDDYHDHFGVFDFMWSAGLISNQTYKNLNVLCYFQSFIHSSSECEKILQVAYEEFGNIDPYCIFTSSYTANAVFSKNKLLKRLQLLGRLNENYDPALWNVRLFILTRLTFRKHFIDTINENWKDSPSSMLPIYHGLRIWIFSGNADAVLPVTGTRYNVEALRLPIVIPWYAWYDDGQVGGWTQVYEGLTFVIVRGAGHEVPLH